MRTFLAPAHLALTIIILVWDIALAGRIAQNRRAPRFFQAVCALSALLILPGLLLTLATSTITTGRAVATMDWVWPAVLILFAIQAVYALAKGLVNLAWGIPIAVYDVLIAVVGLVHYSVAHGGSPAHPLVALLAARSLAMVFAGGSSGVLMNPIYLNVPMVSPSFPALRPLTATFRLLMSLLAVMWVVFIIALGFPRAVVQLRNYAAHKNDQLRERPNGDFTVGLKIFPDIASPPPPPAVRSDSALIDTLDVHTLEVVVVPGATKAAIDSLGHLLDPSRRDSSILIVAIGYRGKLLPDLRKSKLDVEQRIATMRQVLTKLRPTIVLPAEDPYGSGERAFGELPPSEWESFLTAAARAAKQAYPRVRVGVSASAYNENDSTLFAWAAAPGSPIDVVGFSLLPSPYVGGGIQSDTRTADRWLSVAPPKKPLWVFAAGGYPLAYGEASQRDAIWEVLAWATDHPAIKGLIVYEAGDYGQSRGLRAPDGRLRPAAGAVMKAIRAIRESAR